MSKVLLAEDDYTMVSLLKTLLSMEGFNVVTALDKKESFLEVVRQERPDVILLDVHLGDRNGLDLVRDLRADPQLKETRVIMCSGINMEAECLTGGADDFLLKPYVVDDLLRKVRAWAGKE